jgi:hypothetical protein
VAAIVAYEPNGHIWPQGEVPPPIQRADGVLVAADQGVQNDVVPLEEFLKLTKIPIQIVAGDNVPMQLDPANTTKSGINWKTAELDFDNPNNSLKPSTGTEAMP